MSLDISRLTSKVRSCDDDENRNEINVNFSSIENLIEILIGLTQLDEKFQICPISWNFLT